MILPSAAALGTVGMLGLGLYKWLLQRDFLPVMLRDTIILAVCSLPPVEPWHGLPRQPARVFSRVCARRSQHFNALRAQLRSHAGVL